MARTGIIDLGSNSIRLVIYELKKDAVKDFASDMGTKASKRSKAKAKKPFNVLVDEKKIVGLSSYVENGKLTEKGIDKAISVLGALLQLAKSLSCKRVDIFATAVLRNCSNSKAATKRIEGAIDHPIRVLSAKEEAYLGFVGASIGREMTDGTLIDIGGGSAELTALREGSDHQGISIPGGCVSFFAKYVSLILPSDAECKMMSEAFSDLLDQAGSLKEFRNRHAFGIGGSIRAIGKVLMQLDPSRKDAMRVTRADLDDLFHVLRKDTSTFAHAAAKSSPDRLHTLVPGMVIVNTTMNRLGIDDITICKYGIREGYLLSEAVKQ